MVIFLWWESDATTDSTHFLATKKHQLHEDVAVREDEKEEEAEDQAQAALEKVLPELLFHLLGTHECLSNHHRS